MKAKIESLTQDNKRSDRIAAAFEMVVYILDYLEEAERQSVLILAGDWNKQRTKEDRK